MSWLDARSLGMTSLRRLRSAGGGAAVILTYHRVADAPDDSRGIAITPARFAEHVRALADRYEPMMAGELMRRLSEGERLPRRGLCLTLDDGYSDALSTALPVLSKHGVPATVFVCSGYVDVPREFWWDELERLIMHPADLPRHIELTAGDARCATAPPSEDGTGRPQSRPDRIAVLRYLTGLLEPLSSEAREDALRQIREQTGQERLVRADTRPLTASELVRLADSGLVEIGAHTVNHVRLGSRPLAEQRSEIEQSKRRLEEMTGSAVVSFSYPHGTAGSFTSATQRLVREAGFLGAVTTRLGTLLPWGSASRGSDRFALPRTATADVAASELVALIDKRLGV
jgi:peptidoglycan/xylan/chitin deacetylase (PgdA/CDA1 family)